MHSERRRINIGVKAGISRKEQVLDGNSTDIFYVMNHKSYGSELRSVNQVRKHIVYIIVNILISYTNSFTIYCV